VTVTSANVHGLVPSPEEPVISQPPGENGTDDSPGATEPVQGLHIKGIAHPIGN
jgi:hypothetical protein